MILLSTGSEWRTNPPLRRMRPQGNELRRPHERLVNLMHSNAICKSAPLGHSRNGFACLPDHCPGNPRGHFCAPRNVLPPLTWFALKRTALFYRHAVDGTGAAFLFTGVPSRLGGTEKSHAGCPAPASVFSQCAHARSALVPATAACARQLTAIPGRPHQTATAASQHGRTLPCAALALTMSR